MLYDIIKLGDIMVKRLVRVMIMDVITYVILFIVIPEFFMRGIDDYIWMSLCLISTMIITFSFYVDYTLRKSDLLFSIPFLSLLIIAFNNKEIYGISNEGLFDITPYQVDSVFIAIVIFIVQIFCAYIHDLKHTKKR